MAESFVFEIAGSILGKLATLAFDEIGLVWGEKSKVDRIELTHLQSKLFFWMLLIRRRRADMWRTED